jgi:16S rRNA (adenine1518-N6/adenine1519-N6)-dimethyltransferase
MVSPASISTVRKMMERYELHPKKKWGQNFLVDQNILNKIITACKLEQDSLVVEIGPGMGALTQRLADTGSRVLSIDIDQQLKPILEESVGGYENVRVIFGDILEHNLEQELIQAFGLAKITPYKVCANIPYNITTPIIFNLLEQCPNLQAAVLMVQKEVAVRLAAGPGNKDYGLLTLNVAYYAEVEMITQVSHNCFYPRPEVDSSVVKITPYPDGRKKVTVKDEQVFKHFMKAAFQKRRKTILNSCVSFFKLQKAEAIRLLQEVQINPETRPEQLTLENFARITDMFWKQGAS